MNDVIDALAEWRGAKIHRDQAIRRILANENMGLAIRPGTDIDSSRFALADAKLIPDAEGRARIVLVTAGNRSAAFEAEQDATGGVEYSNPTGWEVFAVELEGVDAVVVDPDTPHEFVIESAEFAGLKEVAEAVAIEGVWQRLHDGFEEDDDVSRAARYPAYRLAAVQREGGSVLIFVPNDDGSQAIPVFTHTDALALAMAEFEENFAPDEIQVMKLGGAQMFPVLAQQKDAAGIVVNYRGPSEPVAFKLDVTELMLQELAKG
jgi:hypothetical protein